MSRASHLRLKYGITEEQYDELLAKQAYCCAICDRRAIDFKTRLAVDHDHATGEIRGLLCAYCNHRVVGRHRDPILLRKIACYVEQGTGLFVPKKVYKRKKKLDTT